MMDPWFSASLTTRRLGSWPNSHLRTSVTVSMATLIIRDSGFALTNRCPCQLQVGFSDRSTWPYSVPLLRGTAVVSASERRAWEKSSNLKLTESDIDSLKGSIKQGTPRKIYGISCYLHSIVTELTPNAAHFILFGCLVLKDFQTTVTSVWSRTIYLCNKWRMTRFHWRNFCIFTYSVGPLTLWGKKWPTDRYYIWRHFLHSPKDSHFPSTFLSIGSRFLTDRTFWTFDREPAWITSVGNCLHQLWLLCRRSNKGDVHTRQEKEQLLDY